MRPTRYQRRTNSPALSKVRAVANRHRKYFTKNIPSFNDALELDINNNELVENNILDDKSNTDTQANNSIAEGKSFNFDFNTIVDKAKEFKKNRTINKNLYLDSLIKEPKANMFKMLFQAGTAVKSVASVDNITLNSLAVLFINIIKWIAFGAGIACIIGKYVNIAPFSIVRLNFTSLSKIAVFIGLFAIIFEYLSYLLISIYCGLQMNYVKMRKLAEISARGSVLPTILYIISILLMIYKGLGIGVLFFIASLFVALILKIYGLTQNIKISVTRQLPIYFLCVMLSVFCFVKILPYFSEGLLDIIKNILNI